jgi:hypothetical protein
MATINAQHSTPSAFCSYLQWAYISGVELTGNATDYATLRTGACTTFYKGTLQNYANINNQDNHIVSTSFTSNLIGLLNTAKNLPVTTPLAEELGDTESEKTTGRYYSYVTLSSNQFYAIATSLLSGAITSVPASSTVVFEIDATNTVSAWYNDEAYNLAGCGALTCSVDDYTRELQKTVVYTDLASTC